MIHTIGHSTRPAEALVGLLKAHGVDRLVDVRRYPGSRRHPQYNREALARTLDEAGIGYRHAPELGGRRGAADATAEPPSAADTSARVGASSGPAGGRSPNDGWRNASFRAYADYMGTPAFRDALDRLIAEGEERDVAIMCAEAVPWRCHRNLISDALAARGVPVRHITSTAEPSPHAVNPMARVAEDGTVTYPGAPTEQAELFRSEVDQETSDR